MREVSCRAIAFGQKIRTVLRYFCGAPRELKNFFAAAQKRLTKDLLFNIIFEQNKDAADSRRESFAQFPAEVLRFNKDYP